MSRLCKGLLCQDMEQKDYDSGTTLHVDAAEGHIEAVKFLIEARKGILLSRTGEATFAWMMLCSSTTKRWSNCFKISMTPTSSPRRGPRQQLRPCPERTQKSWCKRKPGLQSLLKKKHGLPIQLMHSHQNCYGELLQWGQHSHLVTWASVFCENQNTPFPQE